MDSKLSEMQLAKGIELLRQKLSAETRPAYGITAESVSTIVLDVATKAGGKLSTASGALVRLGGGPTFLVTNRHVVTGLHQDTNEVLSKTGAVPDTLLALIPAEDPKAGLVFMIVEIPLLDDGWKPRWTEHPKYGAKADIVAIPLPKSAPSSEQMRRFTYDVGKPHVGFLSPGEIVSVVGFPFGRSVDNTAIWATGFVATEPGANCDNLPVMLIDCRSREGQSGSPVLFSRLGGMIPTGPNTAALHNGRVTDFLGIYSGRINNESDLGKVWKAAAVADLLVAAAAAQD